VALISGGIAKRYASDKVVIVNNIYRYKGKREITGQVARDNETGEWRKL